MTEIEKILYQYQDDCSATKSLWKYYRQHLMQDSQDDNSDHYRKEASHLFKEHIQQRQKYDPDSKDFPTVEQINSYKPCPKAVKDTIFYLRLADEHFKQAIIETLPSYLPDDQNDFGGKNENLEKLMKWVNEKRPVSWGPYNWRVRSFSPDEEEQNLMREMLQQTQEAIKKFNKDIEQVIVLYETWKTQKNEEILKEIIAVMQSMPEPTKKLPAQLKQLSDSHQFKKALLSEILKEESNNEKVNQEKTTDPSSPVPKQAPQGNMLKKFFGVPANQDLIAAIKKQEEEKKNIEIVIKEANLWKNNKDEENLDHLDIIIQKMLDMPATAGKIPQWLNEELQNTALRNAIADRVVEQSKMKDNSIFPDLNKKLNEQTMLQKWLKTPTKYGASRGLMTLFANKLRLFEGQTTSYRKLKTLLQGKNKEGESKLKRSR